jgi:hypothetical protein
LGADEHLHVLNDEEIRHVRSYERGLLLAAAGLSVLGFLTYYLPIYWYPYLFPAAELKIPFAGVARFPWSEILWCVGLTSVELVLLVLLNIAGVHHIAVATGFINAQTKAERTSALLLIGLETKAKQVTQYGIDPFQGLNKWVLLLYNVMFRLKGWLGNQVIRYLVRLLLGRYAVRTVLDFSGLPVYMMINALAVYTVLREARVIIMGQALIAMTLKRLPQRQLSAPEKILLYDTLQYIAISKRDFHENHYVLTRNLLEHFDIPCEPCHHLPHDYLERLGRAPTGIAALCQFVILLGFVLDGHFTVRERFKLGALNRLGIIRESHRAVKRYARDFLNGAGVESWSEGYLTRVECSP